MLVLPITTWSLKRFLDIDWRREIAEGSKLKIFQFSAYFQSDHGLQACYNSFLRISGDESRFRTTK